MDNLSIDAVLLALALEEEANPFVHSRYRKRFYRALSLLERRRRDRRIPRAALLSPKDSPWRKVYFSRNDQALITLTGIDFATFELILSRGFEYYFDNYTPFKDGSVQRKLIDKGRPRLMTAADGLGLILSYTRTRGSQDCLEMMFGLTGTTVSDYVRFLCRVLIVVLQQMEDATIKLPSEDEVSRFKDAVAHRHPNLEGVWCTMDGLKLLIECSGDSVVQNRYYNGWTCDHYIGAVFVFCPDGTIPICCYNVPGCVHDSNIATIGGIYDKLAKVHEQNGALCVADSAFSRANYPFIIKSGNQPTGMSSSDAQLLKEATSMRQSAEWGMRAFQSSFPRVKDRFPFEQRGERKVLMKMLILLYNLRARKVGINQIKNVYMSSLDQNVNDLYCQN
jgi:hypothetical protein